MKRTQIFLLLISAAFALSGAFASDLEQEKAALLKTNAEWSAVASEGRDVDRIVSFWTDDATVYPPGSPAINGKPAIRKFVEESLKMPGFSIKWETTNVVISPDARLGYTTGTNSISFIRPNGQPAKMNGKAVSIWRKEKSGAWKCVVDIWNEDSTPASSQSDAQAGLPAESTEADLQGQWRAKVQFQTGSFASVKDLEFLYVFNAGGTLTESSNYDSAPPVPPAYGIWKRTGPGQYVAKYEFYITTPPGSTHLLLTQGWLPAGRGVFTDTITLSADRKSFTSKIKYEAFDASGKPVDGGGTAEARGARLEITQ